MGATNTNTVENAESERFFERGEENGIAFVITEKGYYPNIVKIKYVGDKISDAFKEKEGVEGVKSVGETSAKEDFLSQFNLTEPINQHKNNPDVDKNFTRET